MVDSTVTWDAQRNTVDLAKGTLINLLGKLARLSRLLSKIAATNFFGPSIYGLYGICWSVTSIFFRIGRFGLQDSITKTVVDYTAKNAPDKGEKAVGIGLLIGLITGGCTAMLLFFISPYINDYLVPFANKGRSVDDPQLTLGIKIMSLAIPFLVLSTVLLAATRALRIIKYEIYINSCGGPLVLLAGTIASGLIGWGFIGLAGTQVVMGCSVLLLSIYYFKRHFSLKVALRSIISRGGWSKIIRMSAPVTVSDFFSMIVISLDHFILLKFSSYESVGVYMIARELSSFMKKTPQAFRPIFGPIVAEISFHRHTEDLCDKLAFVIRWILIVNTAYVGSLWLVGDRIISVFGSEFVAGIESLWILCIGMSTFSISHPIENVFTMSGRPYINLISNGIWLLSLLCLGLWLTPMYGMIGIAWSTAIALLIVAILRFGCLYYLGRINPLRVSMLKPIIAIIPGLYVGYLFQNSYFFSPLWSLVPELLLLLGGFVIVLYWLGFEGEDKMLLSKFYKRIKPLS